MATRAVRPAGDAPRRQTTGRSRVSGHQGFLGHRGFLWLWIALAISGLVIATYAMIDVEPRHNGGSWYGYTLGTIGALLILWLTMLGIRKRAATPGRWSLKGWTSAHVYLGLTLIVIGTLHSGLQLGWNVHTLAWALMMIVILSGMVGIWFYATLPRALSANRAEEGGAITEAQLIEQLRSLDRQLHDAAQPLGPVDAATVQKVLEQDPFAGNLLNRLTGAYPGCATGRALQRLQGGDEAVVRVTGLLERKQATLKRLRRHLRIKSMLQVWLYVHVPMTFALLAALSAHIVSVFFYW